MSQLPQVSRSPLDLVVENQRRLVEGLNETKMLLRKVLEDNDRSDDAKMVRPTTLFEMKALSAGGAEDWISRALVEFQQVCT